MVNVGSLPQQANGVFDLNSQAGITHLLASIRSSDISTEQRNELRDLVFLYSNGGKEPTVRLALEQKINAYRVTPAPVKVAEKPLPPPPAIGKFRAAPSFSVPQNLASNTAAAKPDFTAAPAWQSPKPVAEPVVEQETKVVPEVVATVSQEVEAAVIPEVVAPAVELETPPTQKAAPEVAVVATSNDDSEKYLQRIREIKSLVNEKVGNPVNLVDINNEVGREYMGALLDAMKKINSGGSATSAMQRLEDAFKSVEKVLEGGSVPAVPEVAAAPDIRKSDQESVEEAELPPIGNISSISNEPTFNPPARAVEPLPRPAPVNVTDVPPLATASPFPPMHEESVAEDVVPSSPVSSFSAMSAGPVPVARVPEYHEAAPAAPFASLADLSKPTTPAAVPISSSLKTSVETAGDPYFSAEVDEGLQQLLAEWSIYKKSGLFGTGPKGREHPLFKKMAPLHIPLILAGRFEGATQEIKQSVTDYMNGWRYEQGLIYQQGETFEHYLRRVIRHILDLQSGK